MDIEELDIEEILKKTNIQNHLINLQSKNKNKIKSALTTLATITKLTKRKDALYALCGFYLLEIKCIDDIEFFLDATRNSYSIEIFKLILKDISKDKNIFRRKLFIDDIIRNLAAIIMNANTEEKAEIEFLIENSFWGEKLKDKFLCKLEPEEF